MKKITLRIPIEPVAWQRPKTRLVNGWVKHYSPIKTKTYEQRIGEYWKEATKGFKFDRDQALFVDMVFGLPIPKNTSKRKKEEMNNGTIKHIKKPDTDNLLKAVLDGLNDIAWVDDSQVIRISASKKYSTEPYVYVYIHESVD